MKGIIEAVKYSIQMETDGKKFYTISYEKSGNAVGKELFSWLAKQEDYHLQRFQEIYKSISAQKGWPEVKVRPTEHPAFKTIFGEASRATSKVQAGAKGDIDAANKAIEMEIKSRDYYKEHAAKAPETSVMAFFTAIAAEEQGHYLSLVDYKEYMTDPAGFFTRTEHHSIDGE